VDSKAIEKLEKTIIDRGQLNLDQVLPDEKRRLI
jgi:hypothetical protein